MAVPANVHRALYKRSSPTSDFDQTRAEVDARVGTLRAPLDEESCGGASTTYSVAVLGTGVALLRRTRLSFGRERSDLRSGRVLLSLAVARSEACGQPQVQLRKLGADPDLHVW